ncbi:hypothetical protein GGI21_002241 [Coemansia aciculifera]|nr:hypothetical protein GGI21_002241 [Coemansia aciculifera]
MPLALFAWTVSAHTHLRELEIGTTQYGSGVCIRPFNDPSTIDYPAKDPTDPFMRCRATNTTVRAAKICDAVAGGNITVNWYAGNTPGEMGINPSHKGPCIIWMAPLASNGEGNVWFKIFQDGYNPTTKKWCVDTINANNGNLTVTVPSDLLAGQYLLRTEIIALHLAFLPYTGDKNGAEYYSNCAELNVSGSGKSLPSPGVAIPGVYTANMPGIVFNLTAPFTSYTIPGPNVYQVGKPGSVGGGNPGGGTNPPCTKTKKRKRRQLSQEL